MVQLNTLSNTNQSCVPGKVRTKVTSRHQWFLNFMVFTGEGMPKFKNIWVFWKPQILAILKRSIIYKSDDFWRFCSDSRKKNLVIFGTTLEITFFARIATKLVNEYRNNKMWVFLEFFGNSFHYPKTLVSKLSKNPPFYSSMFHRLLSVVILLKL